MAGNPAERDPKYERWKQAHAKNCRNSTSTMVKILKQMSDDFFGDTLVNIRKRRK